MGSYKWFISRVTIDITHIRGLITPFITTHEPPSKTEQNLGSLKPQTPGTTKNETPHLEPETLKP